jgi:hypothetical protein
MMLKLRHTISKPSPAVQQTDRVVLSSPTFLKLADSILTGLDRRTAGELVAGYLYFRATGRTDVDFVRFVFANRLDVILRMVGNSLPVLIPAFFSDAQLRSFLADFFVTSFQTPRSRK